ncbi:hydantoinase/oxoprolinase family protein [Anaerospora sp.]|uniref:hydantoinase/oxoprolinase family protein n=1 Tax=Anaerospora sp. TaxID=1960278 RepID=UPI00289AD197|nr:hydantoinase/oxoprolinase family protein [Anaerospora sp.]
MLLGIDVGGTFTDAVIVFQGKVLAKTKTATTHEDLLQGIFSAIDTVMREAPGTIERVALSTTVVTNSLVEGKTDPVGLLVIPGPGLNIESLLPAKAVVLSGYIDHRGREAAKLINEEIAEACKTFADKHCFAVSGKFAVRNAAQEMTVSREIIARTGTEHVTVASQIAGSLNFLRRTNSAYFNAAVWRRFSRFAAAVEGALFARGVNAPVHILKADGGTMPLALAKCQPVEAIFTGPAASVLGIMAIGTAEGETISLDIGGTTTDIALWRGGSPLFAEQGAAVSGYPTAVRAFWLRSVGMGGDSWVRRSSGKLLIGPERVGPAMAAGGTEPTVADALIVAGLVDFGSRAAAYQALEKLALPDQTPEQAAQEILDGAAENICTAVREMLAAHQARPVYTVTDMVNTKTFTPHAIVGVGGTAEGLAPLVARRMGVACQIPDNGAVANALGAAVARATTDITVRVDTERQVLSVAELGLQEKLPSRGMTIAAVRQLAEKYLSERSGRFGIIPGEVETIYEEEFNLVRGFQTAGKIITCRKQVKPGVLTDVH